jgi:hypothetical protein
MLCSVLPGVYNSSAMRIAKYIYPLMVLICSLGLQYSQVCGVICSFSTCSAWASVRKAPSVEHSGHCHQKRQSSPQERPSDDSQSCPGHYSAASILPSETLSTAVSHHVWQPAPSELVSSFEVLFDLAVSETDRVGNFRAPPRQPHFTVIRI